MVTRLCSNRLHGSLKAMIFGKKVWWLSPNCRLEFFFFFWLIRNFVVYANSTWIGEGKPALHYVAPSNLYKMILISLLQGGAVLILLFCFKQENIIKVKVRMLNIKQNFLWRIKTCKPKTLIALRKAHFLWNLRKAFWWFYSSWKFYTFPVWHLTF